MSVFTARFCFCAFSLLIVFIILELSCDGFQNEFRWRCCLAFARLFGKLMCYYFYLLVSVFNFPWLQLLFLAWMSSSDFHRHLYGSAWFWYWWFPVFGSRKSRTTTRVIRCPLSFDCNPVKDWRWNLFSSMLTGCIISHVFPNKHKMKWTRVL